MYWLLSQLETGPRIILTNCKEVSLPSPGTQNWQRYRLHTPCLKETIKVTTWWSSLPDMKVERAFMLLIVTALTKKGNACFVGFSPTCRTKNQRKIKHEETAPCNAADSKRGLLTINPCQKVFVTRKSSALPLLTSALLCAWLLIACFLGIGYYTMLLPCCVLNAGYSPPPLPRTWSLSLFSSFLCVDRISLHIPTWPGTHYVDKTDLKFTEINLSLPPNDWD